MHGYIYAIILHANFCSTDLIHSFMIVLALLALRLVHAWLLGNISFVAWGLLNRVKFWDCPGNLSLCPKSITDIILDLKDIDSKRKAL